MINPAAAYYRHIDWNRPSSPRRRRVLRVLPLHILAPDQGYLVAGLPLEQAAAYYQYLVASGEGFDGVLNLLNAKGTCLGDNLDPIEVGAEPQASPGCKFVRTLDRRLRHAVLGPSRGDSWAWRRKMGLDPEHYTTWQRVPACWREDISGENMMESLDTLGRLVGRKFERSPNSWHRGARWIRNVAVGFGKDGYHVSVEYGFKRDTSSWGLGLYSRWGETFGEFIPRATSRIEEMLRDKHVDGRKLGEEGYAEFLARAKAADRARKARLRATARKSAPRHTS